MTREKGDGSENVVDEPGYRLLSTTSAPKCRHRRNTYFASISAPHQQTKHSQVKTLHIVLPELSTPSQSPITRSAPTRNQI